MLELDSFESPLTFCNNPLLMAISIIFLLKSVSKIVRVRGKEVTKLVEEYEKFSKNFINYSSQEALTILILDKDWDGKNFLDYAFETGSTRVAKTEFVVQFINSLWNQNELLKNS
jgi:hypothetical protein